MKFDHFIWDLTSAPKHICIIAHNPEYGAMHTCPTCDRDYFLMGPLLLNAAVKDGRESIWIYTDANGRSYYPDKTTSDIPGDIFDTIGNFSDIR